MISTMGTISGQTEINVITSQDYFIVTDDTTASSRKVSYNTIEDTLFRDDVELFSDNTLNLKLFQFSANSDAPDISFYKSRGAEGSPAAVTASDNLSRHIAYAYTSGAQYVMAGSMGFTASDATGNANFTLKSRVSGSNDTRLQITSDGEVHLLGDVVMNVSASHNPGDVNQLAIEATNDTTLTFKLKGSDGVVRTGTLSLS